MKSSRLFLAILAVATVSLWAPPPHVLGANPAEVQESSGEITLRQALALAFARNPDLASFPWELRSGDARILQAGLRPNPELTVDMENFLGTEPSRNCETLETTLSIGQLV